MNPNFCKSDNVALAEGLSEKAIATAAHTLLSERGVALHGQCLR